MSPTEQTANTRKKFTVVGLTSNRQILQNHDYGKPEQQNVILISLTKDLTSG